MQRVVEIWWEECETPRTTQSYIELGCYHFCFVRVTGTNGQYQGEIPDCLSLRQSHDLKQWGNARKL